jgi:hypothetical protein
VAHTCNPIYLGGWDQEDRGFTPALANSLQDSCIQNNHSKIDWKCGSSGKAPALQVQNPECKPQSCPKKGYHDR